MENIFLHFRRFDDLESDYFISTLSFSIDVYGALASLPRRKINEKKEVAAERKREGKKERKAGKKERRERKK